MAERVPAQKPRAEVRWFRGPLILPDRVVENGLVAVSGRRIAGVWDLEREPAPEHPAACTVRVEGFLAPGYIDLHVHGGGGADFMDGDPEAVATITATHARHGTTALLATTLTATEEEILRAIRAVVAAPRRGARILGFHVEGPFVNTNMKGAQDPRYIRPADVAEIDRWLAAGGPDYRWHVTLAPEVEGAMAAIQHLVSRGAVVSAGHTDCTYAQLKAARDAGLRHVTHLFNGMRGLHHREPGAVGGALTLPGLTVEIIADGVHVHPAVIALAVQARGPEAVILITDAMRAAGMPDGQYRLGKLDVTVQSGEARLADGTLAGSVLTMDRAVQNMVRLVGVDLPAAVAMATLNPARLHGLEDRKGRLAPGLDADLVLLDRDLNVQATLVEGQVVYDTGVLENGG
ncbi:MAG TPA: N-acetylglucosamine-6-phosphate deacetylase [Symbiobacteriaceae bacterium]